MQITKTDKKQTVYFVFPNKPEHFVYAFKDLELARQEIYRYGGIIREMELPIEIHDYFSGRLVEEVVDYAEFYQKYPGMKLASYN